MKDVLSERDQNVALAIPLSASNEEDVFFRQYEDSGIYSVKSAYRLLQTQKGSWNSKDDGSVWHLLWSIKALPKALNLVWRALSECLSTLTQLQLKRVPVHVLYLNCQVEAETILHSLVNCTFAWQCWKILVPSIQKHQATCFKTWLLATFKTLDKGKWAEVTNLCWSIWRARNDLVWNQKTTTSLKIVVAARQYLTQWKVTQSQFFSTSLQPQIDGDGATRRVKPQADKVKVSVDAAVFEDRGGVDFGMIGRDSAGEMIEAQALFHTSLVPTVVAKAMAFKEALS